MITPGNPEAYSEVHYSTRITAGHRHTAQEFQIILPGEESLARREFAVTLQLVLAVADAVAPVPVIAAGGIGDARESRRSSPWARRPRC